MPQRRIVCAANLIGARIVLGVRHWDALMHEAAKHADDGPETQGFVDNFGKFLTREEAWSVALAAGQIIHRCGGDGVELYSENLY